MILSATVFFFLSLSLSLSHHNSETMQGRSRCPVSNTPMAAPVPSGHLYRTIEILRSYRPLPKSLSKWICALSPE